MLLLRLLLLTCIISNSKSSSKTHSKLACNWGGLLTLNPSLFLKINPYHPTSSYRRVNPHQQFLLNEFARWGGAVPPLPNPQFSETTIIARVFENGPRPLASLQAPGAINPHFFLSAEPPSRTSVSLRAPPDPAPRPFRFSHAFLK